MLLKSHKIWVLTDIIRIEEFEAIATDYNTDFDPMII